jgi:ketosteroid isomerase-like protein
MTRDELDQWFTAYGRAWETGNPDAAASLFSEKAQYLETPFSPAMTGREAIRTYWRNGVEGSQREVHFSYEILAVTESGGIARWRADFLRIPSGKRVELDGVAQVEMAEDHLCERFHEWWHRRESTP